MSQGPDIAPTAPSVSVLMPVYNAASFLRAALDSVFAQTFADFELIAVDDGSTDDSLAILRDAAARDPRLRVFTRPNTGICGALNDGLAAARGVLIARMDADDLSLPQRFAVQVEYLRQHPECVAVGTWLMRTDPTGSPAGEEHPPLTHEEIDAGLLAARTTGVVHATAMIRRDVLVRIGGWSAGCDWVEDFDLFLRLAEHGRLANVPQVLYRYRRHLGAVCRRQWREMVPRLQRVLEAAYQRRGLSGKPDIAALRPELTAASSDAVFLRAWACHALHAGNNTLARRHAAAALVRSPWSLESWRVMYWALAA